MASCPPVSLGAFLGGTSQLMASNSPLQTTRKPNLARGSPLGTVPFNGQLLAKDSSKTTCGLCHKQFTRARSLKSHLQTHTGERPFACGFCGRAFARGHDRTRHESRHRGEKPFVCYGDWHLVGHESCGRTFSRADALKRHRRSVLRNALGGGSEVIVDRPGMEAASVSALSKTIAPPKTRCLTASSVATAHLPYLGRERSNWMLSRAAGRTDQVAGIAKRLASGGDGDDSASPFGSYDKWWTSYLDACSLERTVRTCHPQAPFMRLDPGPSSERMRCDMVAV